MLAILSYYTDVEKLREHLYLGLENTNNRIIIAFGDSLTEGLYNWPRSRQFSPYTDKLQQLIDLHLKNTTRKSKLKITVKNYGISGERLTKTMKTRLKEILRDEGKADLMIILAGTNDLIDLANRRTNHSRLDRISNDLQTLHLTCYYKDIATVALTIPETRMDVKDANGTFSRARRWVNKELLQFIRVNERKTNTTTLVDISSAIPRVNNSHLWDDGLHLTPQGYAKMGELIYGGIKKLISQWIVESL
eukprot:gene5377-6050_t